MNFNVPEELYYSQNHEWAYVDENTATVGLTEFRLDQIGEVLFLDLPDEGKVVRQGESFLSIESVKIIHDFISPVSGIIMEVNQDLFENPSILNDNPFGDGWIVKIEMDHERDLATLVRATEYREQIGLSKIPDYARSQEQNQ